MEMYGKYNNEEERNNDRSEGRFLNKKKAVAKKMGHNHPEPICADRSCKNQLHGHSWMRSSQKGKESLNIVI
jgi:hypothetical protein